MRKAMLLVPLAALVAVAIVATVDPTGEYGRYLPKCPFFTLTGLSCPGCGTSRAIYALSTGHIAEALSYNYFLPPVILFLLSAVIVEMWPAHFHGLRRLVLSPAVLYGFIALTVGWWIIRNIFDL